MSTTQSSQSTALLDAGVPEYHVGAGPDFDSDSARKRRQDVLAVVRIAASGSGFDRVGLADPIDRPATTA